MRKKRCLNSCWWGKFCRAAGLALLTFASVGGHAAVGIGEIVQVAVASNFTPTLRKLVTRFEQQHPARVVLSSSSSGKLYAQIVNGAPFQLFLSADAQYPERLEHDGLSVADTRFTYAIGRLAVWSPTGAGADDMPAYLRVGAYRRIAIANPVVAPYGAAARAALQHLGLWDEHHAHIARGENIAQTWQFVASRNADLGFVSLAQLRQANIPARQYWIVPEGWHPPLLQQAVMLRTGTGSTAARALLEFLQSDTARRLIEADGYTLPVLSESATTP